MIVPVHMETIGTGVYLVYVGDEPTPIGIVAGNQLLEDYAYEGDR